MITTEKLIKLIKDAFLLTEEAPTDIEIFSFADTFHSDLKKIINYPDWDIREETLAEIEFKIVEFSDNLDFQKRFNESLIVALKISLSESRPCWFVGASWGGTKDQTQRFLDNKIWENGYDDKYIQEIKSIKPGDRIAIKSTYTRKNDLPFNGRGNTASVMCIKATGIVTGNKKDGKLLEVDWQKKFTSPKEWYFYTGRTTVWKVVPGEWMPDALIKFTFDNIPQNYNKFTNHSFWKERFGDIPEEDIRFKWTQFYEDLANSLSLYRYKRTELVACVLNLAEKNDLSYIKGKELEDIDPFTVIGMFNRGMTDTNRRKIATELAEFLNVYTPVPDSFEAIPVLNNHKSWFFAKVGERGTNDIDNLWALFESAKQLADEIDDDEGAAFIDNYNKVSAQRGIRWNLTMGLYWIRPWFYPTLERQSKDYLESLSIKPERNGPRRSCSAADYLLLRENLLLRFSESGFSVHSFPELSLHAWQKPTQQKVGQTITWKNAVLSRVKDLCLSKSSPLYSRAEFKEYYLDELQIMFPENNSVEFSIDSNMQKLRDDGEIEFFSGGQYQWLGFDDGDVEGTPKVGVKAEDYGIENIIKDGCFLPQAALENILSRLKNKKNMILQGPPGTGKTWLGKRLAYALIGQKQPAFIKAVQFHPNLSYEDFIKGWRPSGDGKLSLCEGPFLDTVRQAQQNPKNKYVVVIEEINRGNPAQIFGEMLTLLEADKRTPSEALELSYRQENDEPVYVPENLFVIGTMNVADRSLALVDLALRRRFAFINLQPTFGKPWRDWVNSKNDIEIKHLKSIEKRMLELNSVIENDDRLGPQFKVGHSYVTPAFDSEITDVENWFKQVVETEIYPLLEEYWFDDSKKAAQQKEALVKPL
ncbi:AAA family ATPase [Pseudoalteromonas issachenkonii]|uniref:AAA family ATPase n=1 Tax=Pseudoalteromonas issachenkonii TaxID=152297 RepID=A0ABU9H194_9GAMM|nr:AAA family ATPase [Pseudoalteromonas distincta]MBD0410930.1 AAA family ATPase [Pseudoalteromonas distincta]